MASKTYLKPTMYRSGIIRETSSLDVSDEGGRFNAGYIKGFAVITMGEALGHESWCDEVFIQQVAEQLEAGSDKGVKARFTHPNQCGDSLSKGLGRVYFTRAEDGKVYGDLHFWKAAHKSPDGNLAGYLLDMARDDPSAIGASISFMRDPEAEEMFAAENPTSPDRRNVNNYPHVRLGQLRFVDIVDEPAANPDGLFHRDDTTAKAVELLEYGLGLSDKKPEQVLFGVEPDRLLGFVSNFLNSRGLQVVALNEEGTNEPIVEEVVEVVETPEVEEVVEAPEVEEVVEAPEVEEVVEEEAPVVQEDGVELDPEAAHSPVGKGHFSKEELGNYIESFGKELGVDYFMKDLDFASAQSAYIEQLKEANASLAAKLELSEETENTPLSSNDGEPVEEKGKGFKVTFA